ncbi:winged helix-turn-helix domain-containing protein [Bacillus sp. CGMCC 1.16607]|uniref:winged helix-turn-helix domain-containing protein n=1 Tax=Bacillus sp. CGMCC 1.16607 TaxID=3351842 RepID=UPI00364257FF
MLQFNKLNYSITYNNINISFYPKEFQLLYFLYSNSHQVFSRDHLLEKIWSNESPIDRTIDDHIYRIRKKINSIPFVEIKTVRSSGYQLVDRQHIFPKPSYGNSDITRITSELIEKYKQLGQGNQIIQLEKTKDVLDIQLHFFYTFYSRIMNGDFDWAIKTEEFPFWNKLYFLLQFYYMIQFEASKSVYYFECALAHNRMPYNYQRDTKMLKIFDAYIENNQLDQAFKTLELTDFYIKKDELSNYLIPTKIKYIYAYLFSGNLEKTEETVQEVESLLDNSPYYRETGNFLIARGIWLLITGKEKEAEKSIRDGVSFLKESGFTWFYIKGIHTILFNLKRHFSNERLLSIYSREWTLLDKTYHFSQMEKNLLGQFNTYL